MRIDITESKVRIQGKRNEVVVMVARLYEALIKEQFTKDLWLSLPDFVEQYNRNKNETHTDSKDNRETLPGKMEEVV
jgi:hypothetical protein